MSAPELTAAEREIVDRFGIFAEEERVERVARALFAVNRPYITWTEVTEAVRAHHRALAVAAIEALAPADETGAIERVRALLREAVAAKPEAAPVHISVAKVFHALAGDQQ